MIADGGDARAVDTGLGQGLGQDHLGHADGEVAVAAGSRLHVAVAVADGLRRRGIDHDGAGAARPRLLEDRHHVDVGHRGVAAPDQEQPRVLGEIERVVDLTRAEGLRRPVVGLAAAEPADGVRDAAVEVEEALAHDLEAGERAVALVIEHGQRAVALLRAGELLGDQVEGVVPRQALPAAVHPAEGIELAVGMVEAVAQVMVDLVAERAARDRMLRVAADAHDAAVRDLGHDAAGVEAVEGARGPANLRRRHRRHAVMDPTVDQGHACARDGCSW